MSRIVIPRELSAMSDYLAEMPGYMRGSSNFAGFSARIEGELTKAYNWGWNDALKDKIQEPQWEKKTAFGGYEQKDTRQSQSEAQINPEKG